jgi:chromosome segregation ATPase
MAKIETEVSVRIDVDNSAAVKSVAELKDQIKLASQNLEILKTTFGENSAEVQLSSKYIEQLSNKLKTLEVSGDASKQIAEINNQIKLASISLIGLKEKFGENSAEVIAVEKNISDLKTQLQSVELGTQAIDSLNLINDGIDSTTQSVTALDS